MVVDSYIIYLVHEPIIAAVEHNTKINIFLAGAIGVAAGIAFWAAFERPFMAARLKRPLVAALSPRLRRIAAFAGLPDTFDLHAAGRRSTTVVTLDTHVPSEVHAQAPDELTLPPGVRAEDNTAETT